MDTRERLLAGFDPDYQMPMITRHRMVFLIGEVYPDDDVCKSLINLALDGTGKPITLIISSPGGEVFAGFALIDAVRFAQSVGSEVHGIVWGHALSMACILLQACAVRKASASAILMMHGPKSGAFGDLKDIEAEKKLMDDVNEWLATFIAQRTERDSEYWARVLRGGTPNYYTVGEAMDLGLIDAVTW